MDISYWGHIRFVHIFIGNTPSMIRSKVLSIFSHYWMARPFATCSLSSLIQSYWYETSVIGITTASIVRSGMGAFVGAARRWRMPPYMTIQYQADILRTIFSSNYFAIQYISTNSYICLYLQNSPAVTAIPARCTETCKGCGWTSTLRTSEERPKRESKFLQLCFTINQCEIKNLHALDAFCSFVTGMRWMNVIHHAGGIMEYSIRWLNQQWIGHKNV